MNKLTKTQASKKSLNNLVTQKTSWKSLPTKAIRVPENMANDLLAIAREKDLNGIYAIENTNTHKELEEAIMILQESLKLPANKGGAIKKEIRKALELLKKDNKS